jgi:hypothetical protein
MESKKTRVVYCPNTDKHPKGSKGVIARIYGEMMVSVKRSKHRIQIVGKEYTVLATCPYFFTCGTIVPIPVKDGKVVTDNLQIEEMPEDIILVDDKNDKAKDSKEEQPK